MSTIKLARKAIFITVLFAFLAGDAMAKTAWQQNHPRRVEVNKRLNNQNKRINKEVKEGKVSRVQARNLHQQDRQIRKEERVMASHNHGHITKAEQKALNQQENAVSRKIRR